MCMKRTDDDTLLVRRAAAGDDRAYGELVERYSRQLFALVWRISGRREETEEIVQDALLKAWRALPGFDCRSSFSTWLWRIAVNTAITAVRSHKSQREHSVDERLWSRFSDSEVDDFFDSEADEARVAALSAAIGRLECDERLLVHLFYFERHSMAECAGIMDVSEGNAKVKLHRIRKKLYALIKLYDDER